MTNSRCRHDTATNKLISECSGIIPKLSKIQNILNTSSRRLLMSATVISKINYHSPFLAAETQETKHKVHMIVHRAARFALGSYCYRESISSIMARLQWKMPDEVIAQGSANFFHKIVETRTPQQLYSMIRLPRSRNTTDTTLNERPKSQCLERTAIYAGALNYNRLPADIKCLPPTRMKIKLKTKTLKPP